MSVGYMKKHFNANGTPKKGFRTQAEAEDFRKSMIARGMWSAATSNTYFDNWCGQYHAGKLGAAHRGKGRKTRKNAPRHLDTQ